MSKRRPRSSNAKRTCAIFFVATGITSMKLRLGDSKVTSILLEPTDA